MNSKVISHYDSAQISILSKLQNTVSSLKFLHQKSTEQQTDNIAIEEITFNKVNQKHLIEIQSLKEELQKKNTYIKELETNQKSQESILMKNFKFQLTQLEMTLSQKEAQNQSLQRQVLRQKQKITQLESQLQNQKHEREFYQNNFKKLIETAKGQLKQIVATNQENELTNFMSLLVFKQFTDRIETFSSIGLENNIKNTLMKEKFVKLKKDFSKLMEKNNKLEIENERLTQKLWNLQNNSIYSKDTKNKYINSDNLITLQKQSKRSLKSKDQQITIVKNNNFPFIPVNKSSKPKNFNYPSTLLFQKLQQTLNLVNQYTADMQGIGSSLNEINTKISQQQQTWSQVLIVKQMNTKLKDQLNQLKQAKVNPLLSDQLLKNQHPTLFSYFTNKMSQLQQFQNRLQKMQAQSVRIIQLIDKIMYEGVPTSKPIQPSSKQLHQHQNIIRSKLKKQLQSKFQHQKQIYRQQIQNHFAQKQKSLSQQIDRLNKEIQRLTLKNQDMYKLINQMEEHQQQILQQAQEIRKQQFIMQSSTKKPTQQTQTQINSKIPSPKQQIDKQLLHYLQQKCEDLQCELNQQKSICQKYKKELKFILQNYRVKSTKLKVIRCNECLFTISHEKGECKKCEKCKLQFHQGECFAQHDVNCKKKLPITTRVNQNNNTKKNPQQKKRTSNQLANSTVSQNVDYF